MKHTIIALAAAATLAAALPSSAQAHCRGCGVAAGVVGGLAAGAIIGSAIANSGPTYYAEPAPVYAPRPPPMSHRRKSSKATSATSNVAVSGWKATAGGRAASRSATDVPFYRRMCSSTAAVGQQSTFSPFFFWYAPSAARVSMPAFPSILSL